MNILALKIDDILRVADKEREMYKKNPKQWVKLLDTSNAIGFWWDTQDVKFLLTSTHIIKKIAERIKNNYYGKEITHWASEEMLIIYRNGKEIIMMIDGKTSKEEWKERLAE